MPNPLNTSRIETDERQRETSPQLHLHLLEHMLGGDDQDAFTGDDMMRRVIAMSGALMEALPLVSATAAGRIANTEFWGRGIEQAARHEFPGPSSWEALEEADFEPPLVSGVKHLNFDFSDFTPVEQA